jgi:hypothetical protein
MKKIIMFIMLGMVLASLGGCFIPYHEGGEDYRGQGRERDDRQERRDRDDRHEPRDRDDRQEQRR